MTLGMASPVTDETLDDRQGDRKGGQKSDSAYRTISEVATELNLPQHVLRFWESKFKQISPLKRGGGRRYYRPQDVDLIKRIHHLLHTQGYTIKGVQKLLVKDRNLTGSSVETPAQSSTAPQQDLTPAARDTVQRISETNKSVAPPAPLLANTTRNTSDLQIVLNRLKSLRSQISERC